MIDGFTIGIAIIIPASQIKDLLGLEIAEVPAHFIERVPALWAARDSLNPAALGVGLVTLGLILGLVWLTLWQGKRMRRRLEATERELGIDG